jgi:hypothetical protein
MLVTFEITNVRINCVIVDNGCFHQSHVHLVLIVIVDRTIAVQLGYVEHVKLSLRLFDW